MTIMLQCDTCGKATSGDGDNYDWLRVESLKLDQAIGDQFHDPSHFCSFVCNREWANKMDPAPARVRPDPVCHRFNKQKGDRCSELWPEDKGYWCDGCLNYAATRIKS